MKHFFFLIFLFITVHSFAQKRSNDSMVFRIIYASIENLNYFKAGDLYQEKKNELSAFHQTLVEAYLDNYFNRLQSSEKKIQTLKNKYSVRFNQLPDSVQAEIYALQESNNIKLYNYKEAANVAGTILSHPSYIKNSEDSISAKTAFILYNAIKNVPGQTIDIKQNDSIQLIKDIAGLNNLSVSNGSDSANFVFDTGAGLSTVSESTAKKFNMKILNDSIDVANISGKYTKAKIAVCDYLKFGKVEARHIIFLVFKDSDLAFPQIHYQINGIVGFPVIEALKEIQITKNGKLFAPKQQTLWNNKANLALNDLQPYILIDGRPYIFDTGASETILNKKYYEEHKAYIQNNYRDTVFVLGGAGGMETFKGYIIDFSTTVNNRKITLKKIRVCTTVLGKDSENLYGTIGQDFIQQFDKMTINFDRMFINFE